jgi:hypothetical protein
VKLIITKTINIGRAGKHAGAKKQPREIHGQLTQMTNKRGR